MLKQLVIRLLYLSRALRFYHCVRNRNALTVISLHRVISTEDPRWLTCDPLYTLSTQVFEQCLRFLVDNYSVISLQELSGARLAGAKLPPRPLLITFDDGWADNHHFALPILTKLGLPAALFVAASAIDSREMFFQERLIAGWRSGRLDEFAVRSLWAKVSYGDDFPDDLSAEGQIRRLNGRLQKVSAIERERILAEVVAELRIEGRQMLTKQELRDLHLSGFGIGTHGNHHEPLTEAENIDAELIDSKRKVAKILGVEAANINSLSFPFSRQSKSVIDRATVAGYQLLFGGGQSLTPISSGIPGLIARVGITADEVCDARGNLRPELLANQLFRQPLRQLVAD